MYIFIVEILPEYQPALPPLILPKIREVLADQIVEATVIKPEDFTDNSVFEQTETPNTEEETGDFTPESPAE